MVSFFSKTVNGLMVFYLLFFSFYATMAYIIKFDNLYKVYAEGVLWKKREDIRDYQFS